MNIMAPLRCETSNTITLTGYEMFMAAFFVPQAALHPFRAQQ